MTRDGLWLFLLVSIEHLIPGWGCRFSSLFKYIALCEGLGMAKGRLRHQAYCQSRRLHNRIHTACCVSFVVRASAQC
ncbi:hypothetical protein F4861DRAFT_507083 [Xylaria intraflava]|nr:hypothetical protein F4861DRAFT_507083 [Xylaria intraflava]